jgi:MFS family permease
MPPHTQEGQRLAESPISTAGVAERDTRARLLVPTLVIAGSLMSVVSSLGAPLIPTLARADHVSLSTGEWMLTITLLTGALVTPIMGRLADGPRQRDVVLFALSSVVVGCIVAAVSTNFTELLVGRGLQGFGLGMLPVAMAIARRQLPTEKARRTVATLSVTTAIGVGLGYPVTGLIAEAFDWRAAYWFGAITVAAALALSAVILPSRSAVPSRRLDTIGAVLLSLFVIAISLVLSEGGGWGWTSGRSLGLLAASVGLLSLWIPYELRFADPLVDLRHVRHRAVLTADISGFFISAGMYIFLPTVVVFSQIPVARGYGFGASIEVSGLILVPLSVGSFVASRLLVIYERAFGARSMIPLGSLVFAASAAFFALEHRALWEAFFASALAGLAIGFTSGAMPGFILRAVSNAETGSATGFYQVVRSIGLTLGSAVSSAVLMAHTSRGQALPNASGFRDTLLIGAAIGLLTAGVSFVLPGRTERRRPALTADESHKLAEFMEEEAELAGAGLVLTDAESQTQDRAGSQGEAT